MNAAPKDRSSLIFMKKYTLFGTQYESTKEAFPHSVTLRPSSPQEMKEASTIICNQKESGTRTMDEGMSAGKQSEKDKQERQRKDKGCSGPFFLIFDSLFKAHIILQPLISSEMFNKEKICKWTQSHILTIEIQKGKDYKRRRMNALSPQYPAQPPTSYPLIPIQSLNKSSQMQQKEVLDLIESIVKPLRSRIAHLQKENQRIKAQLAGQSPPKHDYLRQRSSSKDERPHSKKKEQGEPQHPSPSPAAKKKEDASEKPVWGYARGSGKAQNPMKSPPPKDKAPPMPVSPRGLPRTASKEKLQSQKRQGEKPADKKIAGGKKVDPSTEKAPTSSNELPPPVSPPGESVGGVQQ